MHKKGCFIVSFGLPTKDLTSQLREQLVFLMAFIEGLIFIPLIYLLWFEVPIPGTKYHNHNQAVRVQK